MHVIRFSTVACSLNTVWENLKIFFRPWVKKRAKNLTDYFLFFYYFFSFLLDNERLMFPIFFYISQCFKLFSVFKLDFFRYSVSKKQTKKRLENVSICEKFLLIFWRTMIWTMAWGPITTVNLFYRIDTFSNF